MTRVKRGVISQKRKRSTLKAAKGYRGQRSKKERAANDALAHAGANAFAHRRDKKNVNRREWQVAINAAVRTEGMSYSVFTNKLKKAGVVIDRKILATLANENPESFKAVVEKVK
jgi:large subunit ribosomal protein L20